FHLEQARWEEAGIPFWANSRFGIGVLAYFMLADEVAVLSRRVSDRFAGPGEHGLSARILSGSDLFRVAEDARACPGGGTRVRLYVDGRPDELRGRQLLDHVLSWLGIPEIDVDLMEGERVLHALRAGQLTFSPGQLHPDNASTAGGT